MKNIPNILSIFRIILVPFFVYAFLGLENIPLACGIYILAGLTDVIDGHIARKYNLITKLGIVLDPIADILLRLTAMATIAISGLSFMWIVFWILLAKEILLVLGVIFLKLKDRNIVAPAMWYSKVAGVYSFAVVLTLLSCQDILHKEAQIALAFSALAFWVFTLIGYIFNYKDVWKNGRGETK